MTAAPRITRLAGAFLASSPLRARRGRRLRPSGHSLACRSGTWRARCGVRLLGQLQADLGSVELEPFGRPRTALFILDNPKLRRIGGAGCRRPARSPNGRWDGNCSVRRWRRFLLSQEARSRRTSQTPTGASWRIGGAREAAGGQKARHGAEREFPPSSKPEAQSELSITSRKGCEVTVATRPGGAFRTALARSRERGLGDRFQNLFVVRGPVTRGGGGRICINEERRL
jgi:hypothetical protein